MFFLFLYSSRTSPSPSPSLFPLLFISYKLIVKTPFTPCFMAIQYTFECSGTILRVKATGKDDNLEQVENYGLAVWEALNACGCTKVLCDETELEYSLDTFDSFESAKFIAEHAQKVLKAAIVCKASNVEDADFWETVAVNRGFQVKMFKTIEEAEEWLG
jgi:hypothetical protein